MEVNPLLTKSLVAIASVAAPCEGAFGVASAQIPKVPPPDIDLKAAYCIRLEQIRLADMSAAAAIADNPVLDESDRLDMKRINDDLIHQLSDRLNRLQTYLLPRLKYLDSLGLSGAVKRGDIDAEQYNQLVKTCRSNCETRSEGFGKCMTPCVEGELKTRTDQCANLTWLPF